MKKVRIIPGTQEALEAGCTCPVIDNEYGRGYMGQSGVYCYSGDCPIHAYIMEEQEQKEREDWAFLDMEGWED